jgi:hypothetical protein
MCQVGGSDKCDLALRCQEPPCHVTREGGGIFDDGICFLGELSVTISDFALGQVLSFGSPNYVADHHGELHPLHEAMSSGNVPPPQPPSLGLLGVDLGVLARQI